MSVRSVLSVYHAGGQTREVDPMSGYCWPTVYGAEPTLAQYRVTVPCLTPRCMWTSVTEGGPTLTQLLLKASGGYYSQHEVGLLTTVEWILASTGDVGQTLPDTGTVSACTAWPAAQQTRGVEPVLVLCWASIADGGPELVQHCVNVSCLLVVLTGHLCVLHITGCEDIKTVAQLIEPNCRSSSQQQILTQRGVANLVGRRVASRTPVRTCVHIVMKSKKNLTLSEKKEATS